MISISYLFEGLKSKGAMKGAMIGALVAPLTMGPLGLLASTAIGAGVGIGAGAGIEKFRSNKTRTQVPQQTQPIRSNK